jgi:hypothetical protein
VRDEGNRSRKKQNALNDIAESGETKGLWEDKSSQDLGGQTDCDCRGPELAVGAQKKSLAAILEWDCGRLWLRK